MRNLDAARAESQRAIESVYLQTRGLLRLASDIRERRQQVAGHLADLRADAPTVTRGDSGQRAVAALLPAALIAIFVVEWLLAAPTAEWFAVSLLGSADWASTLSWLLPTSIFLLELLVAVQIYEESELRRDGQGGWRAVTLGAFLVVVMPLFSLATQLAVRPEAPELFPMFVARTAGLVLLAFVLHGTVLMIGRLIRESLGWWGFNLQSACWRLRAGLLRRRDQHLTASALSSFTIYRRLHMQHRTAWPGEVMQFGPWDSVARLVIGAELAASNGQAQHEVPELARIFPGPAGMPPPTPGPNGSQAAIL
jgi:hypothetical protein